MKVTKTGDVGCHRYYPMMGASEHLVIIIIIIKTLFYEGNTK